MSAAGKTTADFMPDPDDAATDLRDALRAAGIVLPSLGPDIASPYLMLVCLGSVRAEVALQLANVIRKGAER